jgi:hypothetical protein
LSFHRTLAHVKQTKFAGKPLILQPWQSRLVSKPFGWVNKATGLRRCRTYIEISKGNGMSPLAAALCNYMAFAEGEIGSEVYTAATARQQARYVVDPASKMLQDLVTLDKQIDLANIPGEATCPFPQGATQLVSPPSFSSQDTLRSWTFMMAKTPGQKPFKTNKTRPATGEKVERKTTNRPIPGDTSLIRRSRRIFSYDIPNRRLLKIYAFDPMLGRVPVNRIAIDIPNDPFLKAGPRDTRIEVIDYDGVNKCFYPAVDLNEPALLIQNGMDPTESDPRFHQQMVYAVATKVIENFESALGRRIFFRKKHRLRLIPHAFYGANAFYDSKLLAILFGYFKADKENPGPNIPGQTVFSCLSQDIIAHEMAHALVDRLRHFFLEPTNHDVRAFHEGFADIVSIFQHFSFSAILRDVIQQTRSDLRSPSTLIELARQFGYATGRGAALRSAVNNTDGTRLNAAGYVTTLESHERGAILVAAVFDAFFLTYQSRIKDLIRIATGGTGRLPEGDLHPDLVNRIAGEASAASQSMLRMCIRAFDYLPPVDVTFGDYLRALVTADYELSEADVNGQRGAVVEAFRIRGIYPSNVTSLAQDSVLWDKAPDEVDILPVSSLGELILQNFNRAVSLDSEPVQSITSRISSPRKSAQDDNETGESDLSHPLAGALRRYAIANASELGLDAAYKITLQGFHPVFRVAPHGELVVEMVAQFTQTNNSLNEQFGGVPLRGGATVIASAEGKVRYVISKPLPSLHAPSSIAEAKRREARARYEMQRAFVAECDRSDPYLVWGGNDYLKQRIARLAEFAVLHRGVR